LEKQDIILKMHSILSKNALLSFKCKKKADNYCRRIKIIDKKIVLEISNIKSESSADKNKEKL